MRIIASRSTNCLTQGLNRSVDWTLFTVKIVALKEETNVAKSTVELTCLQLNIFD
jgi:hypothetical protein